MAEIVAEPGERAFVQLVVLEEADVDAVGAQAERFVRHQLGPVLGLVHEPFVRRIRIGAENAVEEAVEADQRGGGVEFADLEVVLEVAGEVAAEPVGGRKLKQRTDL